MTKESGFVIEDLPGSPTVRLSKEYTFSKPPPDSGKEKVEKKGKGKADQSIHNKGNSGITNDSLARQRIEVEFEGYDDRPGRSQVIFLADVIISNLSPDTSQPYGPKLVLTCTSDRSKGYQILSIRSVPEGLSHLDQAVYDGPKMPQEQLGRHYHMPGQENALEEDDEDEESNDDEIEDKETSSDSDEEDEEDIEEEEEDAIGTDPDFHMSHIANGFASYLAERGIDSNFLANAKRYAVHRGRQDQQAGMQFVVDFLAPESTTRPNAATDIPKTFTKSKKDN